MNPSNSIENVRNTSVQNSVLNVDISNASSGELQNVLELANSQITSLQAQVAYVTANAKVQVDKLNRQIDNITNKVIPKVQAKIDQVIE